MRAVVPVLKSLHQLLRIQQQISIVYFAFSTKAKHGKVFFVAFLVSGSVSGGTVVSFF